jgi:cytochrome c-type biogenesis protein CcmH
VIRVILLGVVHLAVLLLFVSPALAVSDPNEMLPDRQQEMRAEAIGHQLRCLVCQNESVEESDADLARDLRRIIRDRVKAGDNDQQVIDWMVARYGDFVRLRPPIDAETLLLWLVPALAPCLGVVAVLLLRRRESEPIAPLSSEERSQIASLMQPNRRTVADFPTRESR